jgi:hypothetical protein
MALYVAERYVPSSSADVGGLVRLDRSAAAGSPVPIRHLRTWLLSADETSFSLFEAPSAELLRAAGLAVGLHYSRITEASEAASEDHDG